MFRSEIICQIVFQLIKLCTPESSMPTTVKSRQPKLAEDFDRIRKVVRIVKVTKR